METQRNDSSENRELEELDLEWDEVDLEPLEEEPAEEPIEEEPIEEEPIEEEPMEEESAEEEPIEELIKEESAEREPELLEEPIDGGTVEEPEVEVTEEEISAEASGSDAALQKIILQVDDNGGDDALDLINVAENMGKSWKMFAWLLVFAVSIGFFIAVLSVGVKGLFGTGSYATAVITFSFDGIDEGLDPNGGLFDVNKIKSTAVINDALDELGWEGVNVDNVRANLKLEGVIPDSVKQQIAVINTVAESSPEYYANIEELNYFPSRYTVTLYRCKGMSGDETRELLDAVLSSYRKYFMDSYADTSALGVVTDVLDIQNYDYMQASEILENQIDTMQEYVDAKMEQAPDFRANSTGLSFSDLSSSIKAVRSLDLNNYISFVQSNNLTKDAGTQVDYFNYQVKQYTFEIQELQNQLSNVERMITEYEKDPVIVMSNQESVTETTQTSEYYDKLLEQKLDLNKQISERNTDLNEAYNMIASLNGGTEGKEEDYAYADSLLAGLLDTIQGWTGLVQRTTEEYYEAELYADAYRISIPAQYTPIGGLGELIKRMVICGGVAALFVILCWAIAGLKTEIVKMRAK